MSSREEFEYEAGKALNLPVSIIEQARKGDRYDHDFDGMSLMQPLNGWWHWWQAGREGLESRLKSAESNDIDARCHVAELEARCAALAAELKQSQIDAGCYKHGMEASNARLIQMAAENAALKAMSDDRRTFIMNGVQLGYIKVPTVETDPALETIRTAVSPQEPTPATEAFLAELHAQGVEMLARSLRGEAEITKACTFNPVQQFEEFAARADECAAKLRQDANTAELVAAGIITKVGE